MIRILLFDVNETLLDLAALDPFFEATFGRAGARADWFALLKETWLVGTAVGRYDDFGTLAGASLRWLAAHDECALPNDAADALRDRIVRLPAHPDVTAGLDALAATDLRLAALTNGTLEAARQQLAQAGLDGYFEQILSADEIETYKPAAAPYRFAAERLGVETNAIRMVAAHAWDLAGAAEAGCATAFVAREGKAAHPLWPAPDLAAPDLERLAVQIVAADG